MSGKVNFILGVHNHLPNGTAEEDFEALYNSKIRPLVSALYQFPRINVVIHYSGVLLYWIERRHPELFVLIQDLLSRKQAELLGGGFYEPMIPVLPFTDRVGQIEMLTTYLRKQFGKRPLGCRLPDYSWEQNLVVSLNACGMSYTFLDENCFRTAGAVPKANFYFEPCITEDQGKLITVFPVSSSLEGAKPAAMLEMIGTLVKEDIGEGPVTVFPSFKFNPDEKADSEYQRFFEELSRADSIIEFVTPGRITKHLTGLKKMFFSGILARMNSVEAKPSDAKAGERYPAERYPTGTDSQILPPRQFMTKYPEAAALYSRMIHTRVLINQLRGDKARKHAALEELWKAQDSSLYRLSGLGNAFVRKAANCALLEAEKITREGNPFSASLSAFDYNLDGEDEIVFLDDKLNGYLKTRGAHLFELDYLPKTWNLLDVFFHAANSGQSINRHGAFSEYLVKGETLPQINWHGIQSARYCGNELFIINKFDRLHRQIQFSLSPDVKKPLGNIEIKKTWSMKRNVLSLQYELKNTGVNQEKFFMIPALNLSFSGGNESFIKILNLRGTVKENVPVQDEINLNDISGLEFRDMKNEYVLSLESNMHFNVKIMNAVLETRYQFTTIMPVFHIPLQPEQTWNAGFTIKISS